MTALLKLYETERRRVQDAQVAPQPPSPPVMAADEEEGDAVAADFDGRPSEGFFLGAAISLVIGLTLWGMVIGGSVWLADWWFTTR